MIKFGDRLKDLFSQFQSLFKGKPTLMDFDFFSKELTNLCNDIQELTRKSNRIISTKRERTKREKAVSPLLYKRLKKQFSLTASTPLARENAVREIKNNSLGLPSSSKIEIHPHPQANLPHQLNLPRNHTTNNSEILRGPPLRTEKEEKEKVINLLHIEEEEKVINISTNEEKDYDLHIEEEEEAEHKKPVEEAKSDSNKNTLQNDKSGILDESENLHN
jgi:hypothetical protein